MRGRFVLDVMFFALVSLLFSPKVVSAELPAACAEIGSASSTICNAKEAAALLQHGVMSSGSLTLEEPASSGPRVSVDSASEAEDRGPGATHSLDDSGFRAVCEVKSNADHEITTYIKRISNTLGLHIKSRKELQKFVHKVKKECGSSHYEALESEVRKGSAFTEAELSDKTNASTTSVGTDQPLDETGYEVVVQNGTAHEMKTFVRRVVSEYGLHIRDKTGFENFVAAFMGQGKTYNDMKAQVATDADAPNSWVTSEEPTPAQRNSTIEHMFDDSKDCAGQDCLDNSTNKSMDGTTAALNPEGFKAVSELNDKKEFEAYTLRVIANVGLVVQDDAGFKKMLEWYDGTKGYGSYEKMVEEIMEKADKPGSWVSAPGSVGANATSGATAPLTEEGYQEVAKLADNNEMDHFVRRTVGALGLRIANEGPLEGLIPWYSGAAPEASVQNFSHLRQELLDKAEEQDAWISTFAKNAVEDSLELTSGTLLNENGSLVISNESGGMLKLKNAVLQNHSGRYVFQAEVLRTKPSLQKENTIAQNNASTKTHRKQGSSQRKHHSKDQGVKSGTSDAAKEKHESQDVADPSSKNIEYLHKASSSKEDEDAAFEAPDINPSSSKMQVSSDSGTWTEDEQQFWDDFPQDASKLKDSSGKATPRTSLATPLSGTSY